MCNQETRIEQCIRGHFGSFVFGNNTFKFIPERPQMTRDSSLKEEEHEAEPCPDMNYAHFKNWIDAIQARDPQMCNNTPALGAAAVTTVILGAQSYRNGMVYYFDPQKGPVNAFEAHQQGQSWAGQWEQISANRGQPKAYPWLDCRRLRKHLGGTNLHVLGRPLGQTATRRKVAKLCSSS